MNEETGERMHPTDEPEARAATASTGRELPDAARRALAEAAERQAAAIAQPLPLEKGGRGGADPARFGDWEVKGIAVDF